MSENEIKTFNEEFGIPSAQRMVQVARPEKHTLGTDIQRLLGWSGDKLRENKGKILGALGGVALATVLFGGPISNMVNHYLGAQEQVDEYNAEQARKTTIETFAAEGKIDASEVISTITITNADDLHRLYGLAMADAQQNNTYQENQNDNADSIKWTSIAQGSYDLNDTFVLTAHKFDDETLLIVQNPENGYIEVSGQ